MATYQDDATTATNAFESSDSPLFTDDAIAKILALTTSSTDPVVSFDTLTPLDNTTVFPGAEVNYINLLTTALQHLTVNGDGPVLVFQGTGGVDATLTGGTPGTERVVFGSSGNDSFTIGDAKTTEIHLGTGTSTVIDNGLGLNTIVGGLGSSTITGNGHTIVDLVGHGPVTNFHITPIIHNFASTQGNAQATGTDQVVITDNTTGKTTTISGVQYVAVDGGDAIIVAASTVEAGVASLYHAAFGRTGDLSGVDYWFTQAKNGMNLHDIAVCFTQSAEYQGTDAGLSDTAFVTQLYQNAFGRTPDASGLAFWLQQLTNHTLTRADLLTNFASVAALNEQGTLSTEATVVGTVTIVPHIV